MLPLLPLLTLAASFSLVSAADFPKLGKRRGDHHQNSKRYTTLTGQYQQEVLSSKYTLSNNLWGMYAGSGSQTSQALSLSGDTVEWSTSWSWSGGENSVKSYANLGIQQGLGVALKDVGSIPIEWEWTRTGNAESSNVAVDGWLSNDPSCGYAVGCSTHELMVWIDHTGPAGPAGSSVGTVTVGGLQWELFTGNVQNWKIASFVAKTSIPNYKADLKLFYDYLIKIGQVSSSEYVTAMQAGTEPFEGEGVTLISKMSISVVEGEEEAEVSSSPVVSGTTTTSNTAGTTTTLKPVPAGTTETTSKPASATMTVSVRPSSLTTTIAPPSSSAPSSAPLPSTPSTGGSLQPFTKALGDLPAPAITRGGRGYLVAGVVEGGASFASWEEARERSCSVQKNLCADMSNAAPNGQAGFSVGDCDAQALECYTASLTSA